MKITVVERLEINKNQAKLLDDLMRRYCSCVRYAYNRLKEGKTRNDLKQKLQSIFKLNSRYADTAIREAKELIERHPDKDIVFGGRSLLIKLTKYAKTNRKKYHELKRIWEEKRKGRVKCIGEREKKGNLNLRILIEKDRNFLRINVANRHWIKAEFTPKHRYWHLIEEAVKRGDPYSVLVRRKDGIYEMHVTVDYKKEPSIGFEEGAIGVDLNPDCIALAECSKDGNFLDGKIIKTSSLLYERKNKRRYLIFQYAKEVVEWAKLKGKGIVIEKLRLDFATKENTLKYFRRHRIRRIFNNFCKKALTAAIVSKAYKEGVKVRAVNPAYTTQIGLLKYAVIYNLNPHLAAAFVIARRGLEAFIACHAGELDDDRRKDTSSSTCREERWVKTAWQVMEVAGLKARLPELMLALRREYGRRWVEVPRLLPHTGGGRDVNSLADGGNLHPQAKCKNLHFA